MSRLFISDLHLSSERPQLASLFLDFLRRQATDAESLYILGDLFEVWIGDDVLDDERFQPEYNEVISALAELTKTGVPVYFMHGNRDFLVAEKFSQLTGCQLISDPTVIDLYGHATLLTHGDLLCTDDVEYQTFRAQVRQAPWQQQFLALPLSERDKIARDYRQDSKKHTAAKAPEIMDVNQSEVETWMQRYQVEWLIHGHTHRPGIHHFRLGDMPVTRYVMDAWYEHGNVLVCTEQGCELTNFS